MNVNSQPQAPVALLLARGLHKIMGRPKTGMDVREVERNLRP